MTSYALASSQERGQLFIKPGAEVYKGQIVGIHQRPGDLSLNVCKKKAATNVRSNKEVSGKNYFPPKKYKKNSFNRDLYFSILTSFNWCMYIQLFLTHHWIIVLMIASSISKKMN